ncbi:MAG: hypothetical protein V1900_03300 [Candidatus Aenigmatarchaeota archaeon]
MADLGLGDRVKIVQIMENGKETVPNTFVGEVGMLTQVNGKYATLVKANGTTTVAPYKSLVIASREEQESYFSGLNVMKASKVEPRETNKLTIEHHGLRIVAKYGGKVYEPAGSGCYGKDEIGIYKFDLPERLRTTNGINHLCLLFNGEDYYAVGLAKTPKDILDQTWRDAKVIMGWEKNDIGLDGNLAEILRKFLKQEQLKPELLSSELFGYTGIIEHNGLIKASDMEEAERLRIRIEIEREYMKRMGVDDPGKLNHEDFIKYRDGLEILFEENGI